MDKDPLLEQAQGGDADALNEVFRHEWRSIFGLAYAALHDRGDAQDVTQEAFLRALRHLDQFQQRGIPFHAYLATIARNLIRDRWRGLVAATVPLQRIELIEPDDVDTAVIMTDEHAHLRGILARLPEDYQTIIRLRVLEERPTEEVAALMERSPGAVRVLQHRAIVALRAQFGKESQP
mgnify:CR=1 FL=1